MNTTEYSNKFLNINEEEKKKLKKKMSKSRINNCIYTGYLSDIAILISICIIIYYIYNINSLKNDTNISLYSRLTKPFDDNLISVILFGIEIIYLLFSAYISFKHRIHRYSTGPLFILYGIILIFLLYETKKKNSTENGLSPLAIIPITIAMFLYNIPNSYNNRLCTK